MNIEFWLPIIAVICFVLAIVFFRKKNVPIDKVIFPFMISLYSPVKMKEQMEKTGITIIIAGYILILIWIFI